MNFDTAVFYWINAHLQSHWLQLFMEYLTEKKSFIFPFGYVVVLLLLGLGRRGVVFLLVATATVILDDVVLHYIFKPLVARIRPCHVVDILRHMSHCSNSYSFPSNHAGNAFTLATLAGLCIPNSRLFGFTLASLICYSRVHLGQHYPSDVFAGALCGILMGYLGYRFNVYLCARFPAIARGPSRPAHAKPTEPA